MYSDGCESKLNGEVNFFNFLIQNFSPKIVFDVGWRDDSDFLSFNGEVHYFEPFSSAIQTLKSKSNNNTKSFFNTFGLSNKTENIYYYPRFQSFCDRVKSCNCSDEQNKLLLKVKTGKEYIEEMNVSRINDPLNSIDFLKIDT